MPLRRPLGCERRVRQRWLRAALRNFDERKAQLLPFVKSAQQGTDVPDPELAKLQRHTGAGGFVWSSTKKDDLAVAGDLVVPRFKILGRDLQRSRQCSWIGQHVQRMSQVNDHGTLARFEFVL